jgi:fluoroquinolone resistance protein
MYYESRHFEKEFPGKGEYESCTFNSVDFTEENLSGIAFIDCKFDSCNLSMCRVESATFQDVTFRDCKILGVRFDTVTPFGLSLRFQNCQLQHASFLGMRMKKTPYIQCVLEGADFTGADLTEAVFQETDLRNATFERSILEKADFRSARNFSIDPEQNRMKKARFSKDNIAGLLDKYKLSLT